MTSLETIKQLRERTGASLQACKKALEETGGDETAAIELLRKKGEAKNASRGDRSTAEGVVAVAAKNGVAVIVKLGCETDFVAKSPEFIDAAQQLADNFVEQGESYDASSTLNDLGTKMGEKIDLGDVKFVKGDHLGSYIHSNLKLGSLVALANGNDDIAKDVAMHVAAMNPQVISPEQISETLVAKEREIWTEQLKGEGKPEEIIGKILMGKEKKFREENALLKQPFVKDPEKTVEQLLGGATVKEFVRLG